MPRRLPNLNQLRAFEAAVRAGSFKAGAAELNVTQAAVSHQIKALEEALGTRLFVRGPREARPTPGALGFAREIGQALDALERAVDHMTAPEDEPIRLSVPPFIGTRWLLPVLLDFADAHPEIPVDPEPTFGLVPLDGGRHDAAIRFGHGDWPGVAARRLFDNVIAPVATPDLVAGRRLPMTPDEIVELPLLADTSAIDDWPDWLASAGFRGGLPPLKVFKAQAMSLDAAISGRGAYLIDIRTTTRAVRDGALVYLHPHRHRTDRQFWMARQAGRRPDPRLEVLTDWLRARAQRLE